MKTHSFLFILCALGITVPLARATTVNMDAAANYTAWTDGSNEGGGFEAWNIESEDGDYGIWDSTDGGLDMGEAFGFTAAGDGASIAVSRDFSTALDDGDVFELDLGLNYVTGEGGSHGFVLYTADGREIITVSHGNSSDITLNGDAVLTNYGTAVMYWTVTQNSATGLTVYATGRGGESEKHTETIELSEESYISGIRFFAGSITNDEYAAGRSLYFDNLTLSQGASSDDTFSYEIDGSCAVITGIADDAAGAVIVPAELGGYTVAAIDRAAFLDCTGMTSLSFEGGDSVTNIAANAFQGCTGLQVAVLPDGLSALSDSLFYGCTNLGSVTIPAGVETIGSSAFAECRVLADAALPDGLAELGESAFLNCRSLTALVIPAGVGAIPDQLCYECRALAALSLPDGATNIGCRAFYNCGSLTSLDVPDSVTVVDDEAFSGCSGLASLSFSGTLAWVGDEAFYDCDALVSIYFYGGVDVLGDAVFGQDEGLAALCFACDEPSLDSGTDLFIGSSQVTVYYDDDFTGWGTAFCGAAVSVWEEILTIASMSVTNGVLQFGMEWDGGSGTAVLQGCTNLVEGSWFDLDSASVDDGSCVLEDSEGCADEHCFYRAYIAE